MYFLNLRFFMLLCFLFWLVLQKKFWKYHSLEHAVHWVIPCVVAGGLLCTVQLAAGMAGSGQPPTISILPETVTGRWGCRRLLHTACSPLASKTSLQHLHRLGHGKSNMNCHLHLLWNILHFRWSMIIEISSSLLWTTFFKTGVYRSEIY